MQFNSLRKDRVATAAHRKKLTIGDTLVTDLVRQGDEVATDSDDPDLWQFIHALNSSDWITAAYYLRGGQSQTLQRARTRPLFLSTSPRYRRRFRRPRRGRV